MASDTALVQVAPATLKAAKVRLSTTSGCRLAVSVYPTFTYDAAGGGGSGAVAPLGGSRVSLVFEPDQLNIPALSWRTARVFGIPIPPPLKIEIVPQKLEGSLDVATGEASLEFEALFRFTAGQLYAAPPLVVATSLTTESSSGQIHSATGMRLAPDGSIRLVGVARVPRVDASRDWFLNAFLMLPTDALAVMEATLDFS